MAGCEGAVETRGGFGELGRRQPEAAGGGASFSSGGAPPSSSRWRKWVNSRMRVGLRRGFFGIMTRSA